MELPEKLQTLKEEQGLGLLSNIGTLSNIAAFAEIDSMHFHQ